MRDSTQEQLHRLRSLRTAAGLTIEELAARSGVSARTIGGIERHTIRRPHPGTLRALGTALGLDGPGTGRLRAADEQVGGVTGLPGVTPHFTGRHADLAWLTTRLGHRRAVQLIGLPGVGTTALAVQAATRLADRFPDGVRFLGPVGDATAATIARRLLPAATTASTGSDPVAVRAYRDLVRARRMLVVLDGVRDTRRVGPLLPPDAAAVTLVTGGQPLAELPDTDRRLVPPLPPADARAALTAMVDGSIPAPAVAELAACCAGLPLALRVTANRLLTRPQWSAQWLIDRLTRPDRVLGALVAGDLSVRDAFERAYAGLPARARRALRLLPRLTGPAPAEAGFLELAERGWLTAGRDHRYLPHPLVHAFARVVPGT
ncbi:helix-turn-helix transcriptional regulator [Micromonospora sp. HM134]|uniref:helix-turn-helix domain-containing protein n=1 Tax=unclassified Micromonospora TaxID=2617518 RepID=UPI0011987409|nr:MULTISPECIES: helix-turn-helix transcriptional regulator [unclassified Micromonospora]QDY08865.1 helix-turn-helix transcriptional regulator [Micromonospora sp. HM134]